MIQQKECHLHLSFGSYGTGTPDIIIKKIDAYLVTRKDISKKLHWSWGSEGEFDYCLLLKDVKKKPGIYLELKKIIPTYSKDGYTVLTDNEGHTHKTQWPK